MTQEQKEVIAEVARKLEVMQNTLQAKHYQQDQKLRVFANSMLKDCARLRGLLEG